jgi:hypothetical protein
MVTDDQLRQNLVNRLGQEVVDRIKGLLVPENIALMAGAGAFVSAFAGTTFGAFAVPALGLVGYALLGKQVFDIGEDLYKGMVTALDAQTDSDLRQAAQRLSDGIVKAAGTGTDLATAQMGVFAAGKIGDKLKKVKGKPKATPDGKVKVETEGAASAKLKENAPSIEGATKPPVPTIRGGFAKWFDELSAAQLDEMWQNPTLRREIENRLRYPGTFHEWLPVSRAPIFKKWGVTAEQVWELRNLTKKVHFKNPSGYHGGPGSTQAHNELFRLMEESPDFATYVSKLQAWANNRLVGGAQALPAGLRP